MTEALQPHKVVVVTGAAGDIGLECARQFRWHRLLLTDVAEPPLQHAAAVLRNEGFEVRTLRCDLTEMEDVARLARMAGSIGRLEVLVHAAGVAPPTAPERILAVNLLGSIHVLNAFELFLTQGVVAVCIASLAAHRRLAATFDEQLRTTNVDGILSALRCRSLKVDASRFAYAISKRGLIAQCQTRAHVWARYGARLVTVSPGVIVDTAMGTARAKNARSASASVLGSACCKRDIATVVAFLSSPQAAFITGCDLLVDGGFLAEIETQWPEEERDRWHGLLC